MLQSVLHYKVIRKLEDGGMGSVYLAEDTRLNREVALKFVSGFSSGDDSKRQRLKNEARAAAALSHPNIAQVYAIEETEDDLFIVMEYIPGEKLRKVIEAGSLSQEEKIRISLQIADAIQAAHEKKVLHRDIKSDNIMIDEKRNAKIMDFGLAHIRGSAHLTKTGMTMGTPAYMSPEQVRGREIDEQSDIWSYGVVLYELFTGELPFQGVYEPAVMYAITEEDPRPASDLAPGVPDRIEHIIHTCLRKNREERYREVGDIIRDLTEDRVREEPFFHVNARKIFRSKITYISAALPVLLLFWALFSPISLSELPRLFGVNKIPVQQRLAIIPMDVIGGDSTYHAIGEGLGETLSSKLSQVERYRDLFWIVPAAEIRNRNIRSAKQAHDAFGINLVVASTIQTFADSLRLTMQLVDAENIHQLDSKIIDVPTGNLVSLQNLAVKAMLDMLEIEFNPVLADAIREGDPARPGAAEFYLQGRAYLQRALTRENLDNAIRLFKKAVAEDSTYALAYAALAESYWRRYDRFQEMDDVNTANKLVEKALELNSKLAPVKITRGVIHAGTGDYDLAITDFREALEIDPGNTEAYLNLARMYERKKLPEQAEKTYKQAIRLKPDLWSGYSHLGAFYWREGRYEEAVEQFRLVTELTPDSHLGYNNLGGIYLHLGESQKALEMFEQSLALDTTLSAASNYGTLKFKEGAYAEAVNWYKVALKLAPDNYQSWGRLANACELDSNCKGEAERHYRKAIELGEKHLSVNPQNPVLLAELAGYYSAVADTAQALGYIERALGLNSEDLNVKLLAVVVYEQLGDREKALQWVDKRLIPYLSDLPKLTDMVADRRFKEMVSDTL